MSSGYAFCISSGNDSGTNTITYVGTTKTGKRSNLNNIVSFFIGCGNYRQMYIEKRYVTDLDPSGYIDVYSIKSNILSENLGLNSNVGTTKIIDISNYDFLYFKAAYAGSGAMTYSFQLIE